MMTVDCGYHIINSGNPVIHSFDFSGYIFTRANSITHHRKTTLTRHSYIENAGKTQHTTPAAPQFDKTHFYTTIILTQLPKKGKNTQFRLWFATKKNR